MKNRQGSDVCGRGRRPPHPPFFVKKSDRSGLGRESESRRPPAAAAAAVAAPEITSGNAKRQKTPKEKKRQREKTPNKN